MDMSKRQIEDFSDLGSPIEFIYSGVEYNIPAIVPSKFNALVKMSKDISKKSAEIQKQIEALESENKEVPDELENDLTRVFEFQIQFTLKAGLKKVVDGNLCEVSFEELLENWPNRLIGKVFRLVNENMMADETSKEKKL